MITLVSFGFRRPNIDQYKPTGVFDVRCLRNPHQHPGMRFLDGKDPKVQAYVRSDPDYPEVEASILKSIKFNTANSVIAIGCYGGKHRSVAVVEMVAAKLRSEGFEVLCMHTSI